MITGTYSFDKKKITIPSYKQLPPTTTTVVEKQIMKATIVRGLQRIQSVLSFESWAPNAQFAADRVSHDHTIQ